MDASLIQASWAGLAPFNSLCRLLTPPKLGRTKWLCTFRPMTEMLAAKWPAHRGEAPQPPQRVAIEGICAQCVHSACSWGIVTAASVKARHNVPHMGLGVHIGSAYMYGRILGRLAG